MSIKHFCYYFIVLIAAQKFHVSCAVVNGKTNAASSESDELDDVINSLTDPKELTDSDIERMKKAFESELTPTQMNELTRILQKFKVGTTPKDHFEGMVELLVLAVGVKSNGTDAEIRSVLGEHIQATTPDTITSNTVQSA